MNFWQLLCRVFGHRWLYDGWWKLNDGGWRRHRTCKRCRRQETYTTNMKSKPLDVVSHY